MLNGSILVAVTFICSVLSVLFLIRFSQKHSIYDSTDDRKIHTGNISRLGGIGIFAGFVTGLVLLYFTFDIQTLGNQLWALIAGSTLIFIMGVWDDIKPWRPRYKLIIQCVAALVILLGNFSFSRITISDLNFVWNMGPWRFPLTFIWIIGVTNAFNLIDGLDGLAGSLTALCALIFALFFFSYANTAAMMVCLILTLAICGFLCFNLPFPKARIFMGDGGSQFLGFVLSVLPLMNHVDGFATIALPYAAAVLMIPIFDTIAAVWRRTREKQKFSTPDRFHLHHKLMLIGFSGRQTLSIVVLFQLIISIFVSVAVWARGLVALVLLLAVYLMGLLFFTIIHFRKQGIIARAERDGE